MNTNFDIREVIRNSDLVSGKQYCQDQYVWFKDSVTGNIYVANAVTRRYTRYNSAVENGKRIPVAEYLAKLAEIRERTHEAETTEQEAVEVAVEAVEETETTEETKGIVKELAPKKARKPRAKKVQVGGMEFVDGEIRVVLTPKQVDFLKHLPDTCFWTEGLDSAIWVDCLCDDIGGQFEGKPMTVGAMISTICEKGLGCRGADRRDNHKCTAFRLTELGQKVAAQLGIH